MDNGRGEALSRAFLSQLGDVRKKGTIRGRQKGGESGDGRRKTNGETIGWTGPETDYNHLGKKKEGKAEVRRVPDSWIKAIVCQIVVVNE